MLHHSYPAKLIALNRMLLFLTSTETTLIHQLGKLLLHQLMDLCDGLLQTLLGRASNVEIQRWVLHRSGISISVLVTEPKWFGVKHTEGVARLLSGK